jgi:DNA repair protein RadC
MDTKKGHRERLRKRFLNAGIKGFLDYEVVELLLTLATPRKDCREIAREAIHRFKTLRGVISAPKEELMKIKGIGPNNYFGIKLVKEAADLFLKQKIIKKDMLRSSIDVFNYLYYSMRDLKKELFKVIFLDGQNNIIEIEDIFEGTLTSSVIYPREIIKSAIKYNSAGLIFVHNHPSGNPNPSEDDKNITKQMVSACKLMDIRVLDHIIIGDNKYYSFADDEQIE